MPKRTQGTFDAQLAESIARRMCDDYQKATAIAGR